MYDKPYVIEVYSDWNESDPDEEGHVFITEEWSTIERGSDKSRTLSKAIGFSRRNPDAYVRVAYKYWSSDTLTVYKNGVQIAFARKNENHYFDWDHRFTLPHNPKIIVERLSVNEKTGEERWYNSHQEFTEDAYPVWMLTRNNSNNHYVTQRLVYPNGRIRYFYWGKELTAEEYQEHLKTQVDGVNFRNQFIIRRDAGQNLSTVTFSRYSFQTADVSVIVRGLQELSDLFIQVAEQAGNKKDEMDILADNLKIAMEKINVALADREQTGSTEGS